MWNLGKFRDFFFFLVPASLRFESKNTFAHMWHLWLSAPHHISFLLNRFSVKNRFRELWMQRFCLTISDILHVTQFYFLFLYWWAFQINQRQYSTMAYRKNAPTYDPLTLLSFLFLVVRWITILLLISIDFWYMLLQIPTQFNKFRTTQKNTNVVKKKVFLVCRLVNANLKIAFTTKIFIMQHVTSVFDFFRFFCPSFVLTLLLLIQYAVCNKLPFTKLYKTRYTFTKYYFM